MRIGLKVAFLESGLTQRAIAASTGIPESRLSGIVRGWFEPTEDERAALARALPALASASAFANGGLPAGVECRGR